MKKTKVILFVPVFELQVRFQKIFEYLNYDVKVFDHGKEITTIYKNIFHFNNIISHNLFNKLLKLYKQKVNELYVRKIDDFKPDMIFIYNDDMFQPDTIQRFKKDCRIVTFLGDSPFFLETSKNILESILESHIIFSPDSSWIEQLKSVGHNNSYFLTFGSNSPIFNKLDNQNKEYDVLFIGRAYSNEAFSYKRGYFLKQFSEFNFSFYCSWGFNKISRYFPELKKNYVKSGFINYNDMNILLNKSKIYPIDSNPILESGLHIRYFDCISCGIFPLPENKKDIKLIFPDLKIPVINDIKEAKEITQYYLDNEIERLNKIKEIENYLERHYSLMETSKYIENKIFMKNFD